MGMIRTKLQAVLNPRSGFYNDSDMIDKLYNRPGYKDYSAIYVYLELCTIYPNYGWMLHSSTSSSISSANSSSEKQPRKRKANESDLFESFVEINQSMKTTSHMHTHESKTEILSRKVEVIGQ